LYLALLDLFNNLLLLSNIYISHLNIIIYTTIHSILQNGKYYINFVDIWELLIDTN